ncbi:hypothetical protein ACFYO1_29310 [Nocardia sp. NPDC006044]|uniref:hypothetical protein n=1 Tax=Nocardia sp. NPDC006044 TaxID=3364306 RepID=UPI0036C9F134
MTFPDHLWALGSRAIMSIPESEADDIYALSFYVTDQDDDPRQPILAIGYDTGTRYEDRAEMVSNPAEARWNFAFWTQNELVTVGDFDSDPVGAGAREEWIKELGYWYETADVPDDNDEWDMRFQPRAEQIEGHFVLLCCELARRLHETGVIERTIGRAVPIIVHELEYYEEIALRTKLANPPGLADDFIEWVLNG